MTAASVVPADPPSDALAAVRDLERSLDARVRAQAEADAIVEQARAEAQAMLADAAARGERAALARREEVLAAAAREAAEALGQAEAYAAELATTVAARRGALEDGLLAAVVPDPGWER